MGSLQDGAELGHVETRRQTDRDAEIAAADLAAKGGALKVEEAGSALEVGQRLGGRRGQAFELGPARQLPAQHIHQRHVVALEDAEEVRDILGDVVDDLGARLERPAEEDAAHAHEGLDIGRMGDVGEPRDDAAREVPLAAQIGRNGRRRLCRRRCNYRL